ncbi:MAG: putative glycoside hydrolase [Faecalibacterium sp.]
MANYHKHRRPRVKRYRHSFYTREARVKKAVSIAVLVLAVLVLAWAAAPHVLDWATHTWYTVVRDRDLDVPVSSELLEEAASSQAAAQAASSAARSELPAVSTEAPDEVLDELSEEPEKEQPAADSAAVVEGSWAEVTVSELTSEASIRTAARRLADQGAVYGLVQLKDASGKLYYVSTVPAARTRAEIMVDPALIASVFEEYGLVPVAQIAAFRDPESAYVDRSMAIHYRSQDSSDYLWLDAANAAAGGKPWLNPYSESAVQFVGDLIEELHGMGFDHVALECVQFPAAVSQKQDFGSTGGASRQAQLAADIAAWQSRFEGSVSLWLEYPLDSCTGTPGTLGAPAARLGMQNLLVDVPSGSTMEDAAREELRVSLLEQGVEYVVIRDDAAGSFR